MIPEMFKRIPLAPRPGVILDLVYHPDRGDTPEFYTLRMYRENIDKLNWNAEDALAIHNWVSDIMRSMRVVDPTISLEIYNSVPRRN